MRQFYDAYKDHKAAVLLVRHVSWSGNLLILSRCKSPEEREFYLRLAHRDGWDKRETDRQLRGALFERAILGRPKVSPAVTLLHPDAEAIFKDSYLVDFLGLPEAHSEHELQTAITANLKRFLLELGRDFAFVGEQYLLSVGGQDFRLDLLFYHRELQSLVAIELKVDEFKPEYLGKLEFYLEALDRDVRKSHENPSIGVLLCASKDNGVGLGHVDSSAFGRNLTVAIAWCVALKRALAVSSGAPVYGMRHCKPEIVSDSQFAWEIASK
jgi:predicted nuclease of restriction endonuclease-like (RecB) superfamily